MSSNETEKPAVRLPEEGTLVLSSSPHLRTGTSTAAIMGKVMLCLLPAAAASIYYFGLDALRVILLCMIFCAGWEMLWCRLAKQKQTVRDLSALLTGLILALNVSPKMPWWLCLVGSFVAIIIAKQVFGGLGQNPFNPAAVARVALLAGAAKPMTTWAALPSAAGQLDGVTSATPLTAASQAAAQHADLAFFDSKAFLTDAFLGNIGGSLGETCSLAILIGAAGLVLFGLIRLYIPLAILLTVTVFVWIVNSMAPGTTPGPMFHLLTGGVLLGSFFMATDYVTSPVTHLGGVVYGVGIGVIVCVIRIWGSFPEGMSFAIVIMNALVPLIDKLCYKRPFGWNPVNAYQPQPRRGEIK
ncbi:MAG: RnfABCDGE type electron transport complex subunit D [Lentisphaeria bacterium]|nr:RnfABCDGE type electron transport complex subunit D [Lentisphaeria bacterium]